MQICLRGLWYIRREPTADPRHRDVCHAQGIGQLLVASTAAPRRVLVDGVPGAFAHDPAAGTTLVQLPLGPKLTRDVSLSY